MSPRPVHLRGGRLVDPATGVDAELDLIISDGRVSAIGRSLATPDGGMPVDCRGLVVAPGFIDLHAHVREPGDERKETIASGALAAAAGGFTAICCMPNTSPPNDSREVTELILARSKAAGLVRVYPIGAISQGLRGVSLTDFRDLKSAGVVAVSDDGRPVMNALLMRRALESARRCELTLIQHAEDTNLSDGGAMNEGASSVKAGLHGQPQEAEDIMVARDLILVELTGARYHLAHASTARSVALIRAAKAKGLHVTCEVTPHHLTLTDEACLSLDTSTKMYPPLRTAADVSALRAGLMDGTVDAIATDHAPHGPAEKDVEFSCAAFGMIGLETALPLALSLVNDDFPLVQVLERLTAGPARVLGLPGGSLRPGASADVVCLDLEEKWQVSAGALHSKSANSAFIGQTMTGRAVLTMVAGTIIYDLKGLAQ